MLTQSFKLDVQKRLTLQEGGGCLSVFGLPFLGAGIFMLLAALGLVPSENAKNMKGFEHVIFFLMGLVFSGVGGSLVFGRKWLMIDRPRGLVTEAYGLLVPMKQKTARLRDFQSVVLAFKEGDSDTADRYPLTLEDSNGQRTFALTSPADFGNARDMALKVADYLGCPFVDRTSGNVTIYDPKGKDTGSVPARMENTAPPDLPRRPSALKSTITDRQGILEIFIPAPKFFTTFVPFLIIIVLFSVFSDFLPVLKTMVVHGIWKPHFMPKMIFPAFIVGVFLLSLLGNSFASRNGRKFGALITISRDSLTLKEKNPGKSMTRVIPIATIVAIDVMGLADAKTRRRPSANRPAGTPSPFDPASSSALAPGKNRYGFVARLISSMNRLVLKTDREIIPFGYGLTRDEANYLCALINRRLRGL